jgi:hypothetical protein
MNYKILLTLITLLNASYGYAGNPYATKVTLVPTLSTVGRASDVQTVPAIHSGVMQQIRPFTQNQFISRQPITTQPVTTNVLIPAPPITSGSIPLRSGPSQRVGFYQEPTTVLQPIAPKTYN